MNIVKEPIYCGWVSGLFPILDSVVKVHVEKLCFMGTKTFTISEGEADSSMS